MSEVKELERKRNDADELIVDVLRKVPEEKKREILCVILGFTMGVEIQGDHR